MTETLVTISLTFPTIDRAAVADLVAPVAKAAIAAGGRTCNVSVQPYDPDDDDG